MGQTCDDWASIDLPNHLYMLNNKWGKAQATGDSYQCVQDNRVDYKWVTQSGGNTVKAYPAIISGWHYGYKYGQGVGGLPVRVYESPRLMTSWHITHEKKKDFEQLNTSWDIWLGPIDDPNPQRPGVEVMIWMNHVAQYPIGSKVDSVNIWGMGWDLWRGTMSDGVATWDVFTFVNQQGIWGIDNQNLFDFFDLLWKRNQLDGRRYIIGVEAGNEVMDGEGSFTYNYDLKVNP